MTNADDPLPVERATVWSGGPCPRCGINGSLLLLRRRGDGKLLFHDPSCGLAFTFVGRTEVPEMGRSLVEVAPDGADAASADEIAAAGLREQVEPGYEGDLRVLLGERDREPWTPPPPEVAPLLPDTPDGWPHRLVMILSVIVAGGLLIAFLVKAWGIFARNL